MTHAIVWSGGVDSTALLYKFAGVSSRDYPVRALTIERLHDVNPMQMKMEKEARIRFFRLAKDRGLHINHESLAISGGCPRDSSQVELWMCHLFPYFHDEEEVHFGYIKGDCFWHFRHVYEEAFKLLASRRNKPPVLTFDEADEWAEKWELLRYLRENKVPDDCWWSCEGILTGRKPCGKCNKCEELRVARYKLRRLGKKKRDEKIVKGERK